MVSHPFHSQHSMLRPMGWDHGGKARGAGRDSWEARSFVGSDVSLWLYSTCKAQHKNWGVPVPFALGNPQPCYCTGQIITALAPISEQPQLPLNPVSAGALQSWAGD